MIHETTDHGAFQLPPPDAAGAALLADSSAYFPIIDIRNRPPEGQQDPPEQQEAPPPPTEQQLAEMRREAEQGRLNTTAGTVFLRGLIANGPQGLTAARDELNRHLTAQNSEYQARIARVDSNGEINFYVVLQRTGENLNTIVTDVHRNGAESEYRNRAIRFQLTPQAPPPRADI